MAFIHLVFLPNPFLTDSKHHSEATDPYIVVDHHNKHLCNHPEKALKYKDTYACKGYLGYYTPNHGASHNPPTISPSTETIQAYEKKSEEHNKYEKIRDDEFAEKIGDYITHLLEKLFTLRFNMRILLWILLLSAMPFCAYSKVGDLYYCEMTQAIEIKEGKLINYIPQKFKFRVVQEDLIQFGTDANYFSGIEFKIIDFAENGEQFYGDNFCLLYTSPSPRD